MLMLSVACHPTGGLTPPHVAMPGRYYAGQPDVDSLSIGMWRWWDIMSDTTLSRLVSLTLDNNRDLLRAAARIDEVRQLYGIAKADFYPVVSARIEGDREVKWYHYPDGSDSYSPDPQVGIKLSVGWELNLFGKLQYARKQAAADYEATVEDMYAMRMSLVAQVASTYFRLIAIDRQTAIVENTIETRRISMEKALLRYESGLTSRMVYDQARTEYLSAKSLLPGLRRQDMMLRDALAVLTGAYPGEMDIFGRLYLDDVMPPELPVGVPSGLLRRRPDLRASAARLKGAEAAVGVAFADRFPSLFLNFTAGLWNVDFAGLFKSPYYYPLGGIKGDVLDFGRKQRQYKASIARYEQARIGYEQDIVNAFKEVREAVQDYGEYCDEGRQKKELVEAAREYLRIAMLQYHAGMTSYLDVLDAQRRLFDAQIDFTEALRDQYLAFVQLYKALGGGWEMPPES